MRKIVKLVTKDSLQKMLDSPDKQYVEQVVGRALVALLKRQTNDEQLNNISKNYNGIGFTSADAFSGCITAKTFIKNNTLTDWQLQRWTRKNDKGYSRLAKYAGQLNEIVKEKSLTNQRHAAP